MFFKKNCYLAIFLLFQVSCTGKAPFVWVENIPIQEQQTPAYRIHPGDQIEVAVWDQGQLSGTYPVREDGYITLPLMGELMVAGSTPIEVAAVIRTKLEGDIVQDVRVVVISRETAPIFVSVIGEVAEPGQIVLKPDDTIVDILAIAGGLTEFADEDAIYVFRQKATPPRVRFDYDRLTSCATCGSHFKLQGGDVIIVE